LILQSPVHPLGSQSDFYVLLELTEVAQDGPEVLAAEVTGTATMLALHRNIGLQIFHLKRDNRFFPAVFTMKTVIEA
jgi:hypothetical protein